MHTCTWIAGCLCLQCLVQRTTSSYSLHALTSSEKRSSKSLMAASSISCLKSAAHRLASICGHPGHVAAQGKSIDETCAAVGSEWMPLSLSFCSVRSHTSVDVPLAVAWGHPCRRGTPQGQQSKASRNAHSHNQLSCCQHNSYLGGGGRGWRFSKKL